MHERDHSAEGVNLPIVAGAAFIVISLAIYWFWYSENPDGLVAIYVVTCVLAILLGSYVGRCSKLKPRAAPTIGFGWLWLACVALTFTVVMNISDYYQSFSELSQFVLEPGDAYERVKFINRNDLFAPSALSQALGPFVTILSFTKYVVFGWSALYWPKLPRGLQVACLASMVFYAAQAVLIGAMVNVGTVLLATMVVFVVKGRSRLRTLNTRSLSRTVTLIALGTVILSYFLGSREASATRFWDRIAAGADGLLFYVSHGYVGLGYALNLPFEWTRGQTILYGFTRLVTGEVPPGSYLVRAEIFNGWSSTQLWSTVAPWLASDITFGGVPLLLLAVGVWAGRLWKECCATLDPFALLLLGQLTIGVFFFPANNHLLQTFPNAMSFVIITLGYLISRRGATASRSQHPN